SAEAAQLMHAGQLALEQRGVGLEQAFDAAGALGAGDRTNARALSDQFVLADVALDQQQVAAVQRHRQRGLGRLAEQQVALAEVVESFALREPQLQLQGDAAVRHLDLQRVAQGAHQLPTAQRVGQVVLFVVLAVEQHQAAAVVEGVQFRLIQRGGLLQAVAVAPQQFGQARPRQTAKLLLGAELDSQDRALRRGLRQRFRNRWLLRTRLLEVGLV